MRTYHVARGFIAIGLMFTIGCADGQREGNHGKGKKLVRNRGLVGLNTPSKTSDGKPLVTGLDANAQKSIEATIAGLKNGVEIKTFAAGTYQLVSTTTTFSLPMPNHYVLALVTTEYSPEQQWRATPGTTVAVGRLDPAIIQPTRTIDLPLELKMRANPDGSIGPQPMNQRALISTIAAKNQVIALNETLTALDPKAPPKLGLSNLFEVTSDEIDDGQGNSAGLSALQLENGDLRFVVKVTEVSTDADKTTVFRNFYLTYRPRAEATKPTAGSPAGPQMTPAEADQAVVNRKR